MRFCLIFGFEKINNRIQKCFFLLEEKESKLISSQSQIEVIKTEKRISEIPTLTTLLNSPKHIL